MCNGFITDERGSVTIEAAVGIASLMVVLAAGIAGVATVGAYVSAVDTAGAAARAEAVGVHMDPPRGEIHSTVVDGVVEVTAEVPAPYGTMRAVTRFPVEYAQDSSAAQTGTLTEAGER